MKKSMLRKVLLLACSAVLLVCLSVGATIAYLTDSKEVKNTFTVGKVEIELDEIDYDNSTTGKDRDKENKYHLLPAHEYDKDPTVYILPDSEESYIRVFVTITNSKAFDELFKTYGFQISDWVDVSTDWKYIANTEDEQNNTRTYELWYKDGAKQDATSSTETRTLTPVFTKITVPNKLTNTDIAKLNNLEIKVVAQAIQADGFVDAKDAWDTLDGKK